MPFFVNGIPTIQTKIQFNQPGFRGCPGCDHAALIGEIGQHGFIVGAHKKFTVENSGLLVLAINDLKVSDNAGGFDVKITVALPVSSSSGSQARAPSKKKGSSADSGPSDPCTRFSVTSMAKSPLIVPGAASFGLVRASSG